MAYNFDTREFDMNEVFDVLTPQQQREVLRYMLYVLQRDDEHGQQIDTPTNYVS